MSQIERSWKEADFELYARQKSMVGAVADTWLRAFSDEFLSVHGKRADLRILDFGFGDGRYFDLFTRHVPAEQLYGIEVSQLRTDRARARGWIHLSCLKAMDRLPYEDRSFHFVNMVEVIEHIPRQVIPHTLAELARVMRPEGVAIITTPNYPIKRIYDVIDAVRQGFWSRLRDDPTHVTRYDHSRLRQLLSTYYSDVSLFPYKTGLFYRRLPKNVLCHKIMAICRGPQTLTQPQSDSLR